ncbi:MAG TPA: acyl-CoA thioesterase [Chloroflexia bacterium]|nr:acyl-CoA thioesterase [Chloroflexia bacterium]
MMESHDAYIEGQRLERGPDAPDEENWGYSFPIVVRFNDLDAMGHVNNAVYLTYCEMARVGYLRAVGGLGAFGQLDMILARAEVDYRMPIEFTDRLAVQVRATAIGTKSFTLATACWSSAPAAATWPVRHARSSSATTTPPGTASPCPRR